MGFVERLAISIDGRFAVTGVAEPDDERWPPDPYSRSPEVIEARRMSGMARWDLAGGREVWRRRHRGDAFALTGNGRYVGETDHEVIASDARTGEVRFRSEVLWRGDARGPTALSPVGRIVVVARRTGLELFSLEDGAPGFGDRRPERVERGLHFLACKRAERPRERDGLSHHRQTGFIVSSMRLRWAPQPCRSIVADRGALAIPAELRSDRASSCGQVRRESSRVTAHRG